MNKRKRNDSGSSKKGQTGSLDEVAAISAAVKTFTVQDAAKPRAFHNTGLPAYFNLREAENALTKGPSDKTIFSFELTNKSRLFVIGSWTEFAKICFERNDNCYPSFKYNYEVLFDNTPMKLYCDAEYYQSENEEKDTELVLDALEYYICKVLGEISSPPDPTDLQVETCHRDGKMSFHIKVPDRFGIVTSMAQQRAFWSRVTQLAEQDSKVQDVEKKNQALNLRVFRTQNSEVREDWVLDFSVYKSYSQQFRNLKAAKCPANGVVKEADFLVPFGKTLKQITVNDWFASLIMKVTPNSPKLAIPSDWLQTASNIVRHETPKKSGDAELQNTTTSDNDFKLFTTLMKEIDTEWSLDNKSRLLVKAVYYNETVDILPRALLVVPKSTYCPIKKGHHDTCAVSLTIRQDGSISINCLSNNHPNQAKNVLHLPMANFNSLIRNEILVEKWGDFRWITSLNERFACLRSAPPKKDVVEFYVDGGECNLDFYSYDYLKTFYKNCSAYSIKQVERKNAAEQQQQGLQKNNPFICWHDSNGRRNFDKIVFDPLSSSKKNLNTWQGFAVKPKESDNPCPLIRQHIKEVLASNNEEHYNYLINWMACLIQRPHIKTKVAPVFISEQGSGKSFLAEVLMKILGVHCVQIIDQQHFFGRFNGFLENRVLIILNESTWGGDKAQEGQLKSYITDDQSTMQEKFGDIKQKRNYLNVMILSNNEFAFPGTQDNRRYCCTEVSNHRIGDYEYFNKLYAEFGNDGAAEFLQFLQRHIIPNGWTPSEQLPRRTPGILRAISHDRSNIELPWLISKLHRSGWKAVIKMETSRGIHTKDSLIIDYNKENYVSSEELMEAWDSECNSNKDLQRYSKIKDIKQLKTFFTKWLCTKDCQLFEDTMIKSPLHGKKVRGYKFGSVVEIRQLFTREWGFAQWNSDEDFDEDEEHSDSLPKTKKPKPSREQINELNRLIAEGSPIGLSYAKHIFGFDESINISEDSNQSDKMSLAHSEQNNDNVDVHNNSIQNKLSDEEALMDDIQDDSDEDQHLNAAYRRVI